MLRYLLFTSLLISGIGSAYGVTLEDRLDKAEAQIAFLSTAINQLKQNPVPINFIYVQLSGQSPPNTLWPNTKWENVTKKYAGLFFRAEGAGSETFGKIQEYQTQSLDFHTNFHQGKLNYVQGITTSNTFNPLPLYTGDASNSGSQYGLSIRQNNIEVRPRNSAIRIWQRIV